jgi:hypothetical protein
MVLEHFFSVKAKWIFVEDFTGGKASQQLGNYFFF